MLLLLLACAGESKSGPADPPAGSADSVSDTITFTAPWEGAEGFEEASGLFAVKVGDTLPGQGWFATGDNDLWGAEGAWVTKSTPPGASEPLMTVSIGGRGKRSTLVLQIVVAKSAWTDESGIELDGKDAVGSVREFQADGDVEVLGYLVGGKLQLDRDGDDDGERAEGSFEDLVLAEPT